MKDHDKRENWFRSSFLAGSNCANAVRWVDGLGGYVGGEVEKGESGLGGSFGVLRACRRAARASNGMGGQGSVMLIGRNEGMRSAVIGLAYT